MSGRGGWAHAPGRRASDAGATFVEILVSIVLLGTVVIGTLAGLRATILASDTDRAQAFAYSWLSAGSEALALADHIPCTSGAPAILAGYQDVLDIVPQPTAWAPSSGATLTVVDVQFLSGAGASESWTATCETTRPTGDAQAQLLELRVASPDGDLVRTLEVIKSA